MMPERKQIQDLFIRVCRDSKYGMEAPRVAHLVGSILGITALEVWLAMPGLEVMNEIAAGKHPACEKRA